MPEEPPEVTAAAHLASRIRAAAQLANLTLGELADVSGVSYTTLTRIVAGTRNPSRDNLSRIASALGFRPAQLRGTGKLVRDAGGHRPGACTARREIARVGPSIITLTCDLLLSGKRSHRGLHHDPGGVVWNGEEEYGENLARAAVTLADLGRPVTTRALIAILAPPAAQAGLSLGEQEHDPSNCDRGGRHHLGPCTGAGPSGVLRVHTDPEQDFDTYGREAGQHASDRAREWQRGD